MNKTIEMLEELYADLKQNKYHGTAQKLLPIIEETKKGGWMPTEQGLPAVRERVLVSYHGQVASGYMIGEDLWCAGDLYVQSVEAWKPLPEPYKESED